MASTTIPRFLLPRGQLYMRSPRLQQYATNLSLRYASTSGPQKARLLEKPDKFRAPSHPQRLRTQRPSYAGPALSEQEVEAQKTKQYPHMMPPEGSFKHWFLTNKFIHLWITLSVLTLLAFFTVLTNFLHETPYRDQLPPNNFFWSHPFKFIGRWMEVYRMHTDYISAQTAERRKQKVEDVRKRSDYRKAHGLESDSDTGLGGWTAKTDDEVKGPAYREGGYVPTVPVPDPALDASPVAANAVESDHVDLESKKQDAPKKWLGIW